MEKALITSSSNKYVLNRKAKAGSSLHLYDYLSEIHFKENYFTTLPYNIKNLKFGVLKWQALIVQGKDNAMCSSDKNQHLTLVVINLMVIFPVAGVINPLNNRSLPCGVGCARTSKISLCVYFSVLIKQNRENCSSRRVRFHSETQLHFKTY